MEKECVEFVQSTLDTHVFQPFHAFWLNKGRINPKQFADFLPGCLVEVTFTIHAWHFPKTKTDSFNARVKQCIVLQPSLYEDEPKAETKKIIPRGITYPGQPTIAGFLKSGSSSNGSKRSRDEMEGSSKNDEAQEGVSS